MRKFYFFLTLTALMPLLLFIGCATDGQSVQQKEVPPITLSENGISLTASYFTENQLLERYGKRSNPFLPPASIFNQNRVIVFELRIEPDSDVNIILKYIELQYNTGVVRPINAFHFENYWEMELTRGDTQQNALGKIKYVINQNLIPNKLTVPKNSVHTGLIVFQGKLPQYGNITLFVPAIDKNGAVIHNFKYEFEL